MLTNRKPQDDGLAGDLEDAIFAAEFGDVIGKHPGTPNVYLDPQLFFRNIGARADDDGRLAIHIPLRDAPPLIEARPPVSGTVPTFGCRHERSSS